MTSARDGRDLVPVLRRAARADRRRPRHVAAVRELRARRAARRDGAVLPAARARLRRAASSCSSRSTSPPEEIFTEYAYFSSYSTSWVEHARALRRDDDRARSTLGADEPRRRARQQRRLPAAVLRRARASRCSASSRPRTSPRPPSERGVADARRVLRRRDCAQSSSPRARSADLLVGNNVLAQVPDLNDFVAGIADPARARTASSRSSSRTCCG